MTPFGRPTGNQSAFQPMLTPAYPAPALVPVEADKNLLQKLGLNLLAIYLFAIFSLLTEVSTEVLGFKPYVTLVAGPLAIILSVISGHALRMLKTKIGFFTFMFLLWLLIAAPFTAWRLGTFNTLTDVFFRTYSIVFMSAALVVSLKDCLRIMYVIAAGGISLFFVSRVYGIVGSDGRFIISFGALMNPNDLATHLLVVLPFCLIVAATTKHTFTIRPLSILLAFGMLLITLKTASRAALISLIVMSLIMLVKAKGRQKLVALGGVAILGVVSLAFLPSNVWLRFATTYSDTNEDESYGVSSREGRKEMLQRSVQVTMSHPIFGVGPGAFVSYDAGEAQKADQRAKWLGTHNSYTQVSSEAGIPALIFFAGALLSAIAASAKIYKRASMQADLKDMAACALFLLIALAGLSVNLFFSHIAYHHYVPVLLGLTISFWLAAKEQLDAVPLNQPSLPPPDNTMMPRAGRPLVQFQPVARRPQPTTR